MKPYLGKALNFFTTLFLVTLVTFLTFQVLPGDPATAILGAEAEEAQIIQKRAELGLDQSLYIRYFKWIGGVLHGDLGNSYRYDQKVFDLIKGSLKTTAALAFLSLLRTCSSYSFAYFSSSLVVVFIKLLSVSSSTSLI